MVSLTIDPTVVEEGTHHDEYAALVAELESEGWTVTMKSQPLEKRGVPGADLPENPVEFYFATKGSESAVRSLIAKIRHHLKGGSRPQTPSPQAVVYGPDGDVLARVPLDEERTE
jgi:hypothetical protein